VAAATGYYALPVQIPVVGYCFGQWYVGWYAGTVVNYCGACGAIIGSIIIKYFPDAGITLPMAALIGMSAMFAGASRAFITSIVFALEATLQSHALLPLLGACTAAYIVSFFLMENTIMTEKIARRGISTPDSFRA
jgi:CIC family chloride channel protein